MQLLSNTHPTPVKRSSGSLRQVQYNFNVSEVNSLYVSIVTSTSLRSQGIMAVFAYCMDCVLSVCAWFKEA